MRNHCVTLAFVLLHFALARGSDLRPHLWPTQKEPSSDDRIIGGEDALPGEFPHQVSIQHRGILGSRHLCGGTIITETHILTAARCVDGVTVSTLAVVAGVNNVHDAAAQVVRVHSVIIHEGYNADTHSNDVALLKLKENLELGGKVQSLALPPEHEVVPEDTECMVIGWGSLTSSGDYYEQLQKAKVTTMSDEECRLFYGQMAIEDSMMCAGEYNEGADACQGDQGGPLLCWGRLHGVNSWGNGCDNPYFPGVYTEVAYYRDWILMYITGF